MMVLMELTKQGEVTFEKYISDPVHTFLTHTYPPSLQFIPPDKGSVYGLYHIKLKLKVVNVAFYR